MSGAARLLEDDALPPGTLVADRFRLVRLLGAGGMGAVYEAQDAQIDRRVAIKLLYVTGKRATQRFEREVRAASRISSRYVAAVHDFGRDPAHGLYMVMELLAGETLDVALSREGALPIARAAVLAADIAEALHAAHGAGVVHRDLKPANVMLLSDGSLKVLDFGIARLDHDASAPQLTAPDTILGTPAYVSPESVAGQSVGPAADLYALGVILFEMLAGARPFADDVPAVLCTKHLRDAPPRVSDMRGDEAAAVVEPLVAALLEKSPEGRPASAAEVAAVLRAVAENASVPIAVPRRRPRVRAWWIGVAVIAVISGGLGGALLALREPGEPAAPVARLPEPVPEPEPLPVIVEPVLAPTIELRVTTTPAGATILLDGEPATSPLTLPRDGREHELMVSARGHRDQTVRVIADEDRTISVVLARSPRRERPMPVKLRSW